MLIQAGIEKIYYIYDYKNDYENIEKLNITIPIIKLDETN